MYRKSYKNDKVKIQKSQIQHRRKTISTKQFTEAHGRPHDTWTSFEKLSVRFICLTLPNQKKRRKGKMICSCKEEVYYQKEVNIERRTSRRGRN